MRMLVSFGEAELAGGGDGGDKEKMEKKVEKNGNEAKLVVM